MKPESVSTKQERIAKLARSHPAMAFTSLNHYLDYTWVKYAYECTRKDGATKIVYCKDGKCNGTYPNVKFDFLGYCFRPRLVRRLRDNILFCGFNPAISVSAMKAMRSAIRGLNLRRQTHLALDAIAQRINPLLRGWIEYYGRYAPSALGLPCSDTSIRRFWLGRCASSSAL